MASSNECIDLAMESGERVASQDQEVPSQSSVDGPVTKPKIIWKNWLNLASYIANAIVTYTSLTGVYGGTNTELSSKYQTLVTPSGWAFSIWGPIFMWEAVFVLAQFFPSFRQSILVMKVSPWWWSLCIMQIAWTVAFAQEQITLSLIFMLSILGSLLAIAGSTDGLRMTALEYVLLRAPFSLQLGWIIAASVVNINVQADAAKSSQQFLLAIAVLSNAIVLAIVTIFTFAVRSPDPIIALVVAWAFAGIATELNNPINLNDPTRFNASIW
eukprot:CAMPEP_0169104660 /NCGR_PEP_ID=MMETSP1015-20121227/23379_1 /TAXON_ID=342587 /ORGANISM="Karlodinium micrum, Strain CCMP2283" /LENGTH=270 /DNA_ID=CAMNT_0009165963 /DNA_START=71 /DNA_END=880 /DNA_ORIENTATION=-